MKNITRRKRTGAILAWAIVLLLNLNNWGSGIAYGQGCDLFPIALSAQQLSNAVPGTILTNIYNGTQPGNFGWLSWGGSPSEPTLVSSLTSPGNSSTYVNPNNPNDHQISIGDWVQSKPGVSNSKNVRDALTALESVDITVPVWDLSTGQGANAQYRVCGFAGVRLISYQLPSQNRITARFLGYATCSAVNLAPVVSAGSDQTITLPTNAVLNGRIIDDGLPAGGLLAARWSEVSGPGTASLSVTTLTNVLNGVSVTNQLSATVTFILPGTYVFRLTASDSLLAATNDVVVTVNRANSAPVANAQTVALDENISTNITLHGSDPDGDPLSYLVVTLPNYGTLSGTPPNLVYTPKPDFSGQDSFTFKVNDGLLDSPAATVSVTIRHVNVAPVADAQSITNYEDTAFPIVLSGSDVEGSALTYHIVSGPTNGTLTGAVTNLTYTPKTNYFGNDAFIFTANDGLTNSAPSEVNITILPVDEPPVVDAGADQLIILPTNSVYLSGTVQYDEFPGTVDTVLWSKVSGPGNVVFTTPDNETTTAFFSQSGTFVLQLVASDSFMSGTDEVVITVNAPPLVNAGPDQTNTQPAIVQLGGMVTDDGVPTNNSVVITWSKISGPGTVVFSSSDSTNSTATFSQGGTYVLRLTGNDGITSASDDVVMVMNEVPIVDAGSDQVVTNLQADLNGTAFDDGLPDAGLVTTWSQISGPGTAVFAAPHSTATTVVFSQSGVYVLNLTADDSLATISDQVTIAVDGTPTVTVTGDPIVNLPSVAALTGNAADDGLPTNSVLTYTWSQFSGPGTVTFGDETALITTASFSTSGVYVVEFSASDSLLSATTNLTIIANQAPVVAVSADRTALNFPHPVSLSGLVSDDGLPYDTLSYSWSRTSGPGAVTFSNPTGTNSMATFSQAGVYALRLTANDSFATGNADILITVLPANQPPVVYAGPSQTNLFPGQVQLAGAVADDGYPANSVSAIWSLVSGPGTVSFDSGSATNATATFSQSGVYLLRLTANDTELTGSSEVTITMNMVPVVDAGTNQLISQTNQAQLAGTITDDGLPLGTLTSVWQMVSGPGTISFDVPTATNNLAGTALTNHPVTTVTFSQSGVYVLGLVANDSLFTNAAQVTITVNAAPVVSAGTDQIVSAPGVAAALNGTATDDGLPVGSVLSVNWSVVSGPGTAVFSNVMTTNSTVSFDQPGIYVLRLTASDSVVTASSDVTLTVQSPNQPPVVHAGNSLTNLHPALIQLTGAAADDGLPAGGVLSVNWSAVSGPGTVTFGNATLTNSTAAFSLPGVYTLRLVASDSQLSATNEILVIEDAAPLVDAGTSQFVFGTNQVSLSGSVTDDGLPPNATLTSDWSKLSGPGTVSFSVSTQTASLNGNTTTNPITTSATFSLPGVYVLRLGADDSFATGSATVTISLNQAPVVDAGAAQTNNLGAAMQLRGVVSDDSLPANALVTATWSQLSGPGAVSFANLHLTNTTVTASVGGVYTLRLTADDTVSTNFSDVSIRFNRAPQALSQTNLVQQGQTVPIVLGGSDPDGDAVTFAVVANPASGALTGTAPNLTYTPNTGFYGQDNFTFVTSDGMSTSAVAQVSITVTPTPRSRTYTTDADFNEGQYFKVVQVTNDEVSLRSKSEAFHNLWVANTSKGTIIRFDTETGEIKGEYKSAPDGEPLSPSRTTVDLDGSVWAGNRNGNSVVHISVPEAELWRDRNNNGVLDTSSGLGDVLPWSSPSNSVNGAQDELIAHYVKVRSQGVRHVSVNANNDVWVSGTSGKFWDLIDGSTGQIIRQEPSVGYGGYGGLIDRHGVIWSANPLMRWDTSLPLTGPSGGNWTAISQPSYGIGLDSKDYIWVSSLGSGIRKFASDGTLIGTYNQGSPNGQGVAVGLDDDVWVASSLLGGTTVGHLKNDGTFVGNVTVGQGPTGVAVDSNGKIWVAHYNSGNVMRIDPNAGPIGADGVTPIGQVDFTSPYLGGQLYNYSDMTGSTLIGFPGNGTWSVVYDSSITHAQWGPVAWNCKIYDDGQLQVTFSTSDDGTNYGPAEILSQPNQTPISLGRYARVAVTFIRSASGQGPVLEDITLGTAGYDAPVVQPTVNLDAGPDRDLQLPLSASLHAAVWHNGFFNYDTNQPFLWSLVSGPGTVEFSNPNTATTSATFTNLGVYDVRVQTTLLGTVYSDDVSINAIPINRSPWVDVGPNRALRYTNQVLHVEAIARDDGLPYGSVLTLQWSKIIGPGTVTFAQPNSATNDITFSAPGLYVLQLSASDGDLTYSSRMEVRVQEVCEVEATDGIAQWWPGNASTKEIVRGNDIYLLNGATNAPAQISYGFQFNGATNYAKAYEHPALDIGSGDGVTIEFWAKASSSGRLFEWYRNGVNGIYADYNTSGGTMTVHLVATNGTDHSFSIGSVLSSSQFQHVAITYDKNSGAAFVYVNGVISYSGNLGSFTPRTTGDFYLAGNPQVAVNGRFGGTIDEMTLYSRVLNAYQIYEIATATFVGKCPVGDNQPPVVSAGGPLSVPLAGTLVQLNGSVTDDAKPAGNGLYSEWRVLSGPGPVTFANSNNPASTAIFSLPGIYALQLYADDGEKSAHSEVEARVNALCSVKNIPGLVGWWTGNNKSTADVMGGNPAIQVNGATFTNGEVGVCFQLDGANDYLKISATTNYDVGLSAAGFTVEWWMKGVVGQNGSVLGWANGVRVERYPNVNQGGGLRCYLGTGGQVVDAGAVLTGDTWTHVAVTYDRGLGQAKMYINGVLVATSSVGTNLLTTASDFYLGQVSGTGSYFSYYAGQLDEVSLYKRALNPEEINNIFVSGSVGKCPNDNNAAPVVYAGPDLFLKGVPGVGTLNGHASDDGLPAGSTVRLQWSQFSGPGSVNFNSPTSAVTIATFSTNGIYVLKLTADDGEAQNSDYVEVRVESLCTVNDPFGLTAWWPGNGQDVDVMSGYDAILGSGTGYAVGAVASAFNFDGANDYVWMLGATNYDVGLSAAGFTVEWWMKGVVGQNGSVLGWANGVRVERYPNVNQGGGLRCYLGTGGQTVDPGPVLTGGTWTHVAVTYDRGLGQAKMYINGVLAATSSVGTNLLTTASDFYLGQVSGIGSYYSYYAGQLDEVSLYKRALNPEEVNNIFVSGSVGKCPNDNNAAPVVYAGPDVSIGSTGLAASLNGVASDDGLPNSSTLSTKWAKYSGPGTVTFANSNSTTTLATFTVNGIYVLQLTADDGEAQSSDLVEARVGTPCVVQDIPNLVAWWTANGTSEDKINNQSAVLGSGTGYAVGAVASAFNFDGANDYVWMLGATNYDVGLSAAGFTVEWWMKGVVGQNGSVLGWANGVRVERYPNVNQGGGLRCYLGTGGQTVDAGAVLTGGTWTHVAVTYDRGLGQAKMYINGVLAATSSVGTNLLTTASDFYLGQVPGLGGYYSYYAGQLDEVSLYTRPLSTNEIQSIYSAGSAGKCLTPPNEPPVAIAGGNQTIYFPSNTITLHGSAYDDGLPSNTLAVAWDYLAGPGSIIFGSPNQSVTTVTFTNTGVYTFELTASDGQYSATNTATVTVLPDPRIPPSVAIYTPQDGTQIRVHAASTNLTVSATVSDPDDGIAGVQFFQNGTLLAALTNGPYVVNATGLLPGTYAFTAVATDLSGLSSTSAPANVTLYLGTNPPAIAFSTPANNSAYEVLTSGTTNLVLNASASDNDGNVVRVDFFQNGTSIATFTNTPYTLGVSNLPAGIYTFTSVATDDDGLTRTSAPVTATVFVDSGLPPTVAIFAPADAGVVTAPTYIIGTADSPILQSYYLQYRFKNPEDAPPAPWTVFATGSASITSNALCTLDPTLLLNGIYEMQLVATDLKNRTAATEIQTFSIERNLKIGHFTLSFQDMNIPVSGIPIQIIRTYDSRDQRTNDFGIGWSLDIRNIKLQKTRSLGPNWYQSTYVGDFGLTSYMLEPMKPREITITMAGDKVYHFRAVLKPDHQIAYPIASVHMTFTNLPGTYGGLAIDGDNEATPDGSLGFVNLINLQDFSYFNPTRFRFTNEVGDVYIIDEKTGLQSLTDRSQNTLFIATNGIIWTNSITHNSGVGVSFVRDAQGRISQIIDPAGKALNYAYGTNGSLATFADRTTNTTTFAYTNAAFPHYLTSITDPRGNQAIRTVYDDDGRMVQQIDADGNVITFGHDFSNDREIVTDRLGHTTINYYDDRGNVVATIDALGNVTTYKFDDADNLLEKVDALGNTNRYTYDGSGNKLTETDPLGYTTRYTYGKYRVLTSITTPRGYTTTNVYDPDAGTLTQETDPLNHVTSYTYDFGGNLLTRTDALGNVISNTYNAAGHIINTATIDAQRGLLNASSFTYDTNGNQLTKSVSRTTPQGVETLITRFAYDGENRLIQTIHPDGSTNTTIYALGLDKPAVEIDPLGRQTLHFYDERGNETNTVFADLTQEITAYDAENRKVAVTDRAGRTTFYTNDALARLTATRMPDGAVARTVYDAIGREIATVDELNNTNRFDYDPNCGCSGRKADVIDPLGHVTHYTYDENANQTAMLDALGRTTTYVYDPLDRPVQTLFHDGTKKVTTYDAVGRRIAETDQNTNTTWFAYDALGRLTAVTNALGKVTSYGYDEMGSLISQTDANNHTTTFEYDAMGRRLKRTLPGNQVETYAYDLAGNLTNKVDFNGHATTYAYDAVNRLLTKQPSSILNPPSSPVTYTYTATGQRATMSDASGQTVYHNNSRDWLTNKTWLPVGQASSLSLHYTYDAHGNVRRIRSGSANGADTSYVYDALNRLESATDARTGTTDYGYDDVGNLAGYVYPNNVSSLYTYDSLNRLTNLMSANAQLSPVAWYRYTVAAGGQRLTANENVVLTNGVRTINRLYTYDATYRLTHESLSVTDPVTVPVNAGIGYTLDDVGNRLARSSTLPGVEGQSLAYDANDRLTTDTYDNNGNTVTGHLVQSATPVSDVYDFEDRLINRNSGQVVIKYDGDGNRVAKTVGGVTTYYLVDDRNPTGYAQVLEELSTSSSQPSTPVLVRIYAYGHDLISQTILDPATQTPDAISYYGYDGHGNVRYLTDVAGNLTDTYDYDAYGNLIAQSGTTPNAYLYCGEQFDADLGLYYNRARYLNPDSGRFWTRDFYGGAIGDPISMHKYLYAASEPINSIDPSGNFTMPEIMISSLIDKIADATRVVNAVRTACKTQSAINAAASIKFWGTVAGMAVSAAMLPSKTGVVLEEKSYAPGSKIKSVSLRGFITKSGPQLQFAVDTKNGGKIRVNWDVSKRAISLQGGANIRFEEISVCGVIVAEAAFAFRGGLGSQIAASEHETVAASVGIEVKILDFVRYQFTVLGNDTLY